MKARQKANLKFFKQQSKARQELFDLAQKQLKEIHKIHNLIRFSQLNEGVKQPLLHTVSRGFANLGNLHIQLKNSIADIHRAREFDLNVKVFMVVICCVVSPPLALLAAFICGPRREDEAPYKDILAAVEEAIRSSNHEIPAQVQKPSSPNMLR